MGELISIAAVAALTLLVWWPNRNEPIRFRFGVAIGVPLLVFGVPLLASGHAGQGANFWKNAALLTGLIGLTSGLTAILAQAFLNMITKRSLGSAELRAAKMRDFADAIERVNASIAASFSDNRKIETDYTRKIADLFQSNGFEDFELVSALPINQQAFGNTQATFRVGPILFRSTRDKGEHLVEIAPFEYPQTFYWDCVLAMALGWQTIEEVMSVNSVPHLEESIGVLKTHFVEICSAFQLTTLQETRRRLNKADKTLQAAMTKHFSDLQKR